MDLLQTLCSFVYAPSEEQPQHDVNEGGIAGFPEWTMVSGSACDISVEMKPCDTELELAVM